MALLRFFFLFLISALLLAPLVKTTSRIIEKPLVILALDNSQSMLRGADSASLALEFLSSLDQAAENLGENFDVRTFTVGENATPRPRFSGEEFSSRESHLSSLFDEVYNRFSNRNVGAIIFATDGLFNKGENPVSASMRLKTPVFPIALGDTLRKKDLALANVRSNAVAFLGNSFPAEISLDAFHCEGQVADLSVYEDSVKILSRQMRIPNPEFHSNISLVFEAKKTGIHRYQAIFDSISGEVNPLNNQKTWFVEVLGKKQKVVILAASPHPDISALRSAIEGLSNYEVLLEYEEKLNAVPPDADLVIAHQVPSISGRKDFLENVLKRKVPVWFILGSRSDLGKFNKLQECLEIQKTIEKSNEAQAIPENGFSAFTFSDKTSQLISTLAPLNAPFGKYSAKGPSQVLFRQKVGLVKTSHPLILFGNSGNSRISVITGDGIWKWRMEEYSLTGKSAGFDELVQKSLQFLISREKAEPLKIRYKRAVPGNEPLTFEAELINEAGEVVNDPDLSIEIKGEDGALYNFTFGKSGLNYYLDAGFFHEGKYTFKATAVLGEKKITQAGIFSVSSMTAEFSNLSADHQMLQRMAAQSGGKVYYPGELENLTEHLKAREELKPVVIEKLSFSDVLNLKWIFFLILAIFSTEWFFRKWNGGY